MIFALQRCIRGVLMISLCALASSAHAGFVEGVDAYKNGDYRVAFEHIEPLAKMGHVHSQFLIAVMYYRGEGASKNTLLGYGWMKLAAEGGHEKAKELLPKLRSEMLDESVTAAERLVSAFAPDALNERLMPRVLANCEYESMTPPKPDKLAKPFYAAEARRMGVSGSVVVELTIAPDGTVRDTRVVRSFPPGAFDDSVLAVTPSWKFHPALKDGQPTTAVHTFTVSFNVDGDSKRELQKHVAEFESKAQEGDPVAQYLYATIMAGHPDYKKPWSDVLPWITKAAQAGLAPAQFELGQSLLMGRGCEQDQTKAVHWLQLAAQQGDANAQVSLARIALTPGVAFDQEKALFWLRQAADQGHERANKYLAAFLAASENERIRHPAKALELLQKIELGDRKEPTTREIRAAALANSGDFDGAVRAQKNAISRAKVLGWDTSSMEERLARYQAKQEWFGNLMF